MSTTFMLSTFTVSEKDNVSIFEDKFKVKLVRVGLTLSVVKPPSSTFKAVSFPIGSTLLLDVSLIRKSLNEM